ncbi:MAG: hypothetical protein AAGE13_01950 [Pseudomonadota bacterium]
MTAWLIASGVGVVAALAGAALLRLRADRDAAPEHLDGRFVLRPSAAIDLVAAILALATLGFAGGILGSLFGTGLGPSDAVLGLAASVAFAALLWTRRQRRLRVLYDARELTLCRPGAKPFTLPWTGLADLHRESRGGRGAAGLAASQIVARRPDGALVRIPSNLRGFAHFAALALDTAERLGTRGTDRDG